MDLLESKETDGKQWRPCVWTETVAMNLENGGPI